MSTRDWGVSSPCAQLVRRPCSTLQCQQQTFPAPAYTGTPPMASPLLGRIGLNFRTGVNVYNAIEAGFTGARLRVCTHFDKRRAITSAAFHPAQPAKRAP